MISRRSRNAFGVYFSNFNRLRSEKVYKSAKINFCPFCTAREKKLEDSPPPPKSQPTKFTEGLPKESSIKDLFTSPYPIEMKSLVKGMFIDKIDDKMLVFPEFDDTNDVAAINSFCLQLERYLVSKLDSKEIDRSGKLPDDVVAHLKNTGVYGLRIPKEFGGLAFNNKSALKVYEELSRDWSLFTSVALQNDLIGRCIELFGNEAQKEKYLPRLANGSITGAFCLHEDCCGQDIAAIETGASYVDGQTTKISLNGKKTWITNADNADILIVFAKLHQYDTTLETVPMTAFIVDRKISSTNIKTVNMKNTIGLKGLVVADLEFKNAEIAEHCILGREGQGYNVASTTINLSRYSFAAATAAFLRRLLAFVSEHCNTTKRWGAVLNDSNLIRNQIAEMGSKVFLLETLAYYIAGRLDEDSTLDFDVEAAIALRESRRCLRESLLIAMEMFGARARTPDLDFERFLRDAITLSSFMSTDDFLTGFIAMEGFKVYSNQHKSILHRASDPIKFPWDNLMEKFARRDLYKSSFKFKHYINEKVHPSLEYAARFIEETMAKFEHVFKAVLFSSGKATEDEHLVLARVADLLTILFCMVTAVSRASRSYSIGLRNADQETYMAHVICMTMRTKALHVMNELIELECPNIEDVAVMKIGDSILRCKGYQLEHPTARNCDPAMKQFLLHLDDTLALGFRFVIKDLDETHLFISQESVATLQQKIDSLMESLSPEFVDK